MRAGPITLSFALTLLAVAPAAAQEEEPAPPADEPPPAAEAQTVEEGQPRYLAAMENELNAMRVRGARCEAADPQRARCQFAARGITTGREFAIRIVYSDRTDTIYMYVERYLTAPADGQTTDALLRRLMELNWTLLLGKFEWSSTDGEVRLAMILNTDSNFDRRAFRSAVRGIGQLADRYFNELDRLVRGQPAE
ncbi:MAG: YbjN domain-containing protein [Sandaracinaceae bacterium]